MRRVYSSVLTPTRPWIEESAFRETTLFNIDDPNEREAVRQAGGVFYRSLLTATMRCGTTEDDPSVTRGELRAVLADLRFTAGYCTHLIARSPQESELNPSDTELCRFAGKIGKKLSRLARQIEERLA